MYDALKIAAGQMIGSDLISGDRLLGLLAGVLDDPNLAASHFDAAIEFCKKAGYRPELAWTNSDYAEFLVARDADRAREKATELQDEAIAIATELGMAATVGACAGAAGDVEGLIVTLDRRMRGSE